MQLNEQNKIALVKMSRNNKQPIERLFHWPIVDYTACSAHCTHTRQSPAISQSRDRCGSDAVKHVNTHTCCHVTWSRNPAWLSGECLDVTYSPSFLSNSHQPRWQPISIHLSVGQLKTRLLPREWHSGVYAHVKKTNPPNEVSFYYLTSRSHPVPRTTTINVISNHICVIGWPLKMLHSKDFAAPHYNFGKIELTSATSVFAKRVYI